MGASTVNVCHLLRSGTLLLLVILNLNASYPLEVMVNKIPEGSTCDLKHSLVANTGTCVVVAHCPPAIKSVKTRRQHDLARCGFRGIFEVVCCPTDEIITDDDDDRKERTSTTTTTTTTAAELPLNSTAKTIPRGPEIKQRQSAQACADISSLFNETKVSFQISNGVDAEVGEFPHMVALSYDVDEGDNSYRCGGTLISDRFVLTAGHCVVNADRKRPVRCRMGSIDTLGNDGVEVPVLRIILHEEFQRKVKNDIAIIELENSVNYTKTLHPACLYQDADDPIGLVITGWGRLGAVNDTSRILQKGLVNPVKLSDCNATFRRNPISSISIKHSQLCAMSEEKGDSGGPIQVVGPSSSVYYVIGITSFGPACGGSSPGVYTRVYSYLDWIERIVWPK